jgi:hypothetical protein
MAMTENERALLLTVAHWALRLEGGVAADLGEEDHPSLRRLRELIAVVEGDDDRALGAEE